MNDIEVRHVLNLLAYADKLANDAYKKGLALLAAEHAEKARQAA